MGSNAPQEWPVKTVAPYVYQDLGYQQVSGSSVMTFGAQGSGATFTVPNGARMVVLSIETNAVRWRADGTAPTASVGNPIGAGQAEQYSGPLATLQIIAQTGSATVNAQFYA